MSDNTSRTVQTVLFPCLLSMMVSACGGDTGAASPPQITQQNNTTMVSFPEAEELDPTADEDGDGLSNGDELAGYTIQLNETGWPGQSIAYEVISNPYMADSDGDGLSDREELALRTHPLRGDSDGDGLSDWEENRFWGTSPNSVDTDGDATGAGEGVIKPPNPLLFDGAELNLRRQSLPNIPTPGVPGVGATSPLFADTDGDTVSDYDELLLVSRSPVIAEVVQIEILPGDRSTLEIGLIAEYENGQVDTSSYASSFAFEQGVSTSVSTETSTTVTTSLDTWFYEDITVSAGCCADIVSVDAKVGYGLDASLNMETGFSMGFEAGLSLDMQYAASEASSAAQNQGVTLSGGFVRMSLDLENRGKITTRVADVAMIMRYMDPKTGRLKTLGELVPVESQQEVSLSPGEVTTVQVENMDLPLEAVRQIMEAPRSLAIHLARYDLRDEQDQDFDFLYEAIPERTASITIERFGEVNHFYVAADVFTDVEGNRHGVSLADALSAHNIPFAIRENERGQMAIEIDGIRSELHVTEAPDLQAGGADVAGYEHSGGPGERTLRRGWVGLRRAFDAQDRDTYYTNFFEARIKPGDTVTLLLSEDLDQDGVPALEEALYGSSDLKIHSDARPDLPFGDGMSDFFEIREGWEVMRREFTTYRVFSGPGAIDTDGDGLTDAEEAPFGGVGTDPSREDTDEDGYSDWIEVIEESGWFDPLAQNERTTPVIACTYIRHFEGCERDYTITLQDREGDVLTLELDPADGSQRLDLMSNTWSIGVAIDEQIEVTHCFAGHQSLPGGVVFVRDALGQSEVVECLLQQ